MVETALSANLDGELVEISQDGIEAARRKGSNKCYFGEITDAYSDQFLESYDVVTALEVIGHLYDPLELFRRVYNAPKTWGSFCLYRGELLGNPLLEEALGVFGHTGGPFVLLHSFNCEKVLGDCRI